jgi:hypothetical protein
LRSSLVDEDLEEAKVPGSHIINLKITEKPEEDADESSNDDDGGIIIRTSKKVEVNSEHSSDMPVE